MKQITTLILLSLLLINTSCSSIVRGITTAIVERKTEEAGPPGTCKAKGEAFQGVETYLVEANANGPTRILMVHGIGNHVPGYATRFIENLTNKLHYPVTEKHYKEIELRNAAFKDESLGKLRVSRFLNKERSKELLVYELTWSPVVAEEKQAITYDNSGEYSFRRANINNAMKTFLNSHVSDPMIYLGKMRDKILSSVLEAGCWTLYGDWNALKDNMREQCNAPKFAKQKSIEDINVVFVTHSLGSRLVIDALEAIAGNTGPSVTNKKLAAELKNKEVKVFMLANQLPLLQLGRELPEVSNEMSNYCVEGARKYNKRFLKKLSIVAFSDPNDLLSYAIPADFTSNMIDSRLCPEVSNVILNISKVVKLFGIGELANPLKAHVDYDDDERVIGIIAKGLGHDNIDPLVGKYCAWLETI